MNPKFHSKKDDIASAVSALDGRSLSEELVCKYLHPLFKQTLQASSAHIYLANHSLGRPLDKTREDVNTALAVWYENLNNAWELWGERIEGFRQQIAELIHADSADCIVPKMNAGQGLRTILNCYDKKISVLTTSDEFNSLDFILKNYQLRDRIKLNKVSPSHNHNYVIEDLIERINKSTQLVVVSLVFFSTGQLLEKIDELTESAHKYDALVLIDLYHAAGVIPIDVSALDIDFAVGGSYKYLRGGPGSCWLYIHPRHLDGSLRTLDIGWFAQSEPFDFQRAEKVQFATGGKAFNESTPAVLSYYQAQAGLEFVLKIGVQRLREYSLRQQGLFCELLRQQDICVNCDRYEHGAFLALPHQHADHIAKQLLDSNIITDMREGYLRLCPDILNTDDQLRYASETLIKYLKN